MYDLATYLATEKSPGGPVYIEEELVPHSPKFFMNDLPDNDRPLTRGRAIGQIISAVVLVAMLSYMFIIL
ncbi:hypothetical protein [Sphingomonas sp. VNH70]|uniref:hypothetical protein n=1 Tax=Sphingomonas silueang TaxID=3156617 RepID=UPI0032B3DBBF